MILRELKGCRDEWARIARSNRENEISISCVMWLFSTRNFCNDKSPDLVHRTSRFWMEIEERRPKGDWYNCLRDQISNDWPEIRAIHYHQSIHFQISQSFDWQSPTQSEMRLGDGMHCVLSDSSKQSMLLGSELTMSVIISSFSRPGDYWGSKALPNDSEPDITRQLLLE
jgi:hypothetical protein